MSISVLSLYYLVEAKLCEECVHTFYVKWGLVDVSEGGLARFTHFIVFGVADEPGDLEGRFEQVLLQGVRDCRIWGCGPFKVSIVSFFLFFAVI